jgi:3-phosphoglycerate kinase
LAAIGLADPAIEGADPGPVVLPPPQGRPKGGPEAKYSLSPVVPRLSELLGKPVR